MRFYVTVESADFPLLKEHFPEDWSPEVWFDQDEHGEAFMNLRAADHEPDAEARQGQATEAARRAWGLISLVDAPRGSLVLTGTQQDLGGQRHHVVQSEPTVAFVSVDTPTIVVNGVVVDEDTPPPRTPALLELSARDGNVADMLDIVGNSNLNWADLYKVCEIVAHDIRGRFTIEKAGWATKRKLSAFKASANRRDVSGPDARHARPQGALEPPKETMTRHEARLFIQALAADWLRYRSAVHDFGEEPSPQP